jgi:hypothetical protein
MFGTQTTSLGRTVQLTFGTGVEAAHGKAYFPAYLGVFWTPSERWTFTASTARSHQFTQSLANSESVARHVFPVELSVAAGTGGVPVPHSDKLVVLAEWRPAAGLRIAAEAYLHRMERLALPAPTAGTLALDSATSGRGRARGVSLDASGGGARMGWLARYAWQSVIRDHGTIYQPVHGVAHLIDAGVMLHPSATWSLRVAVSGALGRRASLVAGPFEWEACNLRDGGCEFAGAPVLTGQLGATPLPAYFRADVGVRKHWHVTLRGRSSMIGLFGTITNVLGRGNVLTYTRDDAGALGAVDMRPTGPLVLGMDWRF